MQEVLDSVGGSIIDQFEVGTLAQAKLLNIKALRAGATRIRLSNRGGAIFREWLIGEPALPGTLADYCWFTDAGGTNWMLDGGIVDMEHVGSRGGDVDNDTRCAIAISAWISATGMPMK